MPVIPALRRLGRKNQKFKISWGYIVRPPSQKKKKTTKEQSGMRRGRKGRREEGKKEGGYQLLYQTA